MIAKIYKALFALFALIVGWNSALAQRIEYSINSAWHFHLDNKPNEISVVNLPHTWNSSDAFSNKAPYYRGTGVYTKQLMIPSEWEGKQLFVRFEGANQITKMKVNGSLVGEHKGGYTGFVFSMSNRVRFGEMNEILIEVDNQHHLDIPPLEADFNFYGGIYRDVYLTVTDAVHFDMQNDASGNFLISTPEVSHEKALLEVATTVLNKSEEQKKVDVILSVFAPTGELIAQSSKRTAIKPKQQAELNFNEEINKPQLWSPDSPQLYTAKLSIVDVKSKEQLDLQSSTFGCRWFSFDTKNGFSLNGQPMKLIGANRHQDYPNIGNALPNSLHRNDYQLMKEMGCNYVRIAHYPHDPDTYRLCDELGLLVWSEIPIINEITNSPAFTSNCIQMQREHILQNYNHPSVIMWGYMNEIFLRMVFNRKLSDSDKEQIIDSTMKLAQELEDQTRKLDPYRVTCMALHNNDIYNTTGIADIPHVIGWNLYFGWYDETLDDLGAFLDKQYQQYPNRPLIISEYGPGADVRLQTNTPKPWDYTEAYQIESHRSYYRQVMERFFVTGMAAWNFADFGSKGRQDSKPFINQKGLVNFNRSAKNVYHYYQALLLEEDFVRIARHPQGKYFCNSKNDEALLNLTVFSNQESINLHIDGLVNETQKVVDGIANFTLALPAGNYEITAQAGEATDVYASQIYLRSKLSEALEKGAVGINVGTHSDFYDDLTGEIWMHDQAYEEGQWGYVGGEVYFMNKNKFQGIPHNILSTDNDPLFQTMREGLSEYRIDLPKGSYRVSLLFTEPNKRAVKELIYNLSDSSVQKPVGLRTFNVHVNGQKILHELNLARDYGACHAVEFDFKTEVNNEGLQIKFEEVAGQAVLSGIKLEKISSTMP